MKVYFQTLRDHEAVRLILVEHGWRVDRPSGPAYSARHPAVKDQTAARDRLNEMGLLTSSVVRIAFAPKSSSVPLE
jgi:hypothetical protein